MRLDELLERNIMAIGEILQTVSVLVAASGLFLNWWQLRKNGLQRRAEYITGLFAKYQEDAGVVEMFRRLDLDEEVFRDGFHGSPDETKLDKLLMIFERIATVHEMGVISDDDLDFMAYEFIRIHDNCSVQAYFNWLDEWYKERGIGERSFAALRRTASKLENRRMAVKALDRDVEGVTRSRHSSVESMPHNAGAAPDANRAPRSRHR